MSKFKVGDIVESLCDPDCPSCIFIQGKVVEVGESNGVPICKIELDPSWWFCENELQLEEEYNGN